MFVRYRKHGRPVYESSRVSYNGHVRYTNPAAYPITDVRYTNPAAYPIPDPPRTDVLSVIGNTNRIDPVLLYCILPSVRYRIRGWFRITDVHYRIRGWIRIPDICNTKPAAYPITDMDIYICMYYYILPSYISMSVIGCAAGFVLRMSGCL